MRYAALLSLLFVTGCLWNGQPPPMPVEFGRPNPIAPPERCEPTGEWMVPSGQTPPPEAEGELGVVDVRGDDRFAIDGSIYVAFTWTSDGERIVAATDDGVVIWNAGTGVLERRIDLGARLERSHKVIVSPDDQWIAVVGFMPRQETSAFDVPSMWLVRANGEGGAKRYDGIGEGISFTPDGKQLVAHGHVWDLASGTHTTNTPAVIKHEAKFLPDRTRVLVFIDQEKWPKQAALPELRDVASGRVLHRFPLVQTSVSSSISGDGKRLALLHKGELSVYSLDTFERVAHIANVGEAQMVHLSHDGRRAVVEVLMCMVLASSDADEKKWKCPSPDMSVWDVDSGQRLWHKPEGSGDGWMFTPDGEYLTGPDTRLVEYIMRAKDGTELRFESRIRTISPGGHRVVYEGKLGFEIGSLDGKSVVPEFKRAPRIVDRTADGRLEASIGNDGRLRIESATTCVRLGVVASSWYDRSKSFDYYNSRDQEIVFSPDGTSLYTVLSATSMHALFRAYDTKDGTQRWAIRADGSGGGIASLLPTAGLVLFQGYNHPELRRFNAVTGAELTKGGVPRLSYSPPVGGAVHDVRDHDGIRAGYVGRPVSGRNGARIASSTVAGAQCRLSIWDVRNPRGVEDRKTGCLTLLKALSPDEKWLAAGGEDGHVRILSWNEDRTHKVAAAHSGKITALVFSPASDRLASADARGNILLADPKDGSVKGRVRLPLDHAEHLWISPDGRSLVADTARGLRVRFRIAPPAPR